MKLRHVVASLERQHGGPSVSVRALSEALAKSGHNVELLATATNLPHALEEQSPSGLRIRVFPRDRPHRWARSAALRRTLEREAVEVVHHHGLWLRTLHYAAQAKRHAGAKLVVSPRGMMDPWAWEHHRRRKALAQWLIHPGAFRAVDAWHATSEQEAAAIRDLGFFQPIFVAPNGVASTTAAERMAAREYWQARSPLLRERRVALFYSRLHDKKRVRELIALWATRPADDWILLIVGIPDGISVAELQHSAAAAGTGERILVFDGTSTPAPYAAAEIMLLPTHSENFGLVIAEAMANAVPVVVTATTPWSEIGKAGLGWWVPWDEFPAAVASATSRSAAALRLQGEAAQAWVSNRYSWQQTARQLEGFYHRLLHVR